MFVEILLKVFNNQINKTQSTTKNTKLFFIKNAII